MRALFDRIRALGMTNEDDFIFVEESGKRCPGHDVSCAVVRRAEEAGIKRTSIHGIRRTVSSLLRGVLPISAVANMLGHLEITNEMHYHYDTTEIQEKRDALSKVSSSVIHFPEMPAQMKQAK